jgi:RND family efflux transporter MFP subunit
MVGCKSKWARLSLQAGLILALLSGCDRKLDEEREVIRPVRVARIGEAGSAVRQTLAGIARASKEMTLSFRVAGTIAKLTVKAGDLVKKGDLIAELDTREAGIDVERAKASVARANAEYRSAKADYDRVKLLYAEGSVSRSELDAARALQESKGAMLEAEGKTLEMTVSTLGDHKLVAPLDGSIAEVPSEVNENVGAGQAVALLNAGDKAEIEVAVPERVIELVHKDTKATVKFDSIPDKIFSGVVSEVGVASARGTSGFPIRVALQETDERIRAGMSALVELNLSSNKDVMRVYAPPAAILEDQDKQRYVMVAEPKGEGFAIVKRINVTIGEPTSLGMVVKEGLEGGELAIVAGLSKISDGMKVRLLTEDQPPLAAQRLKKESSPALRPDGLASPGSDTDEGPK